MFNVKIPRAITGILLACLTLLCFGCGESTDTDMTADTATGRFSSQLKACDIVTKASVASTFDIPATNLEKFAFSSTCEYSWEGKNESLSVNIYVADIADSAERAATYFANATRSMSAEEVSSAMNKVRDQAQEKEVLDTAGEKQAAGGIFASIGKNGFTFVDVAGIGDQARFDTNTGELHVLVDNLYFTVSAYRGPNMPMPEKLSPASIMKASREWTQKTLQQRKEAAIKLAKAAVAEL